jgi:hypothetical protein
MRLTFLALALPAIAAAWEPVPTVPPAPTRDRIIPGRETITPGLPEVRSRVDTVERFIPYPVEVERRVPVPYPVEVERRVPVPYPVEVERRVPVYIDRPVYLERPAESVRYVDRPVYLERPAARPRPGLEVRTGAFGHVREVRVGETDVRIGPFGKLRGVRSGGD